MQEHGKRNDYKRHSQAREVWFFEERNNSGALSESDTKDDTGVTTIPASSISDPKQGSGRVSISSKSP